MTLISRGTTLVDNTDLERQIAAELGTTFPASGNRAEGFGTFPYFDGIPGTTGFIFSAGYMISSATDAAGVPLLPNTVHGGVTGLYDGETTPYILFANIPNILSVFGTALQGGSAKTGFAVIMAVDKTTPAIEAGDTIPFDKVVLNGSTDSWGGREEYAASDFRTALVFSAAGTYNYAYFFLTGTGSTTDYPESALLSNLSFDTRLIKGFHENTRRDTTLYEYNSVVDAGSQLNTSLAYQIEYTPNAAANIGSSDGMVSSIVK